MENHLEFLVQQVIELEQVIEHLVTEESLDITF